MRQADKRRRALIATLLLLATLSVAALISAFIASDQRAEAQTAQANALDSQREALKKLGDSNFLLSELSWKQEHNAIKSTYQLYTAASSYRDAEDKSEAKMYMSARERANFGPIRSFPSNGPILGAEQSHDRKQVMTWSEDGTVRVWDIETGHEQKKYQHDNEVISAKLIGGTDRLVTLSDDIVRVWDTRQDSVIRQIPHDGLDTESFVNVVEELQTHESKLLTWTGEAAQLWDLQTAQELRSFKHNSVVKGSKLYSQSAQLLTCCLLYTSPSPRGPY